MLERRTSFVTDRNLANIQLVKVVVVGDGAIGTF
jgi:hypothetical protein